MQKKIRHYYLDTTTRHRIKPGARILVVDDHEDIRELGAAILTREGYEVEVAEDGAKALALLSTRQFDLVSTDRQMPSSAAKNWCSRCARPGTAFR